MVERIYHLSDLSAITVGSITGTWSAGHVVIANDTFKNTIDTVYGEGDPFTANQALSSYEMQEIVPGMILTSVGTNSNVGNTTNGHGILVKTVERQDTNTIILFEGYDSVSFGDLSNESGAMTFKQPTMNGLSVNSAANISLGSNSSLSIGSINSIVYPTAPIPLLVPRFILAAELTLKPFIVGCLNIKASVVSKLL